jgi:hypothetical protein
MAETITQVTQPPAFIEAESKLYLDQLRNAIGGLKGADLSQIMGPQFIAGQDPLQLQAQQAALAGIGGYQPYLQSAAASAGPTAYQQFMSPYQQDVIGTTLQEYDIQAQKGAQGIPAAAIAAGAFGGGREGVQRAEYQSASDRNRAALQAQLLQQGFGQAQQLASQAFGQQMNLAQAAPQLAGQQIAGFNYIGWFNTSSKPSSTFCSTTIRTSSITTTIINCTAIWFRNHGSNIRIPWRNSTNNSTYTRCITNYIRCWFNISWNIFSIKPKTIIWIIGYE